MKHLTLLLFSFLLTLSLHGAEDQFVEGIQPNESISISIKKVPASDQSTISGVYLISASGMLFHADA